MIRICKDKGACHPRALVTSELQEAAKTLSAGSISCRIFSFYQRDDDQTNQFDVREPSTRQLFLLDACGATLSTLLHGVALPRTVAYHGMPTLILYPLAAIALAFAIYGVSCYVVQPRNWRRYLNILAWLNQAYVVLTLITVILFSPLLTMIGYSYFFIEMIVVGSLGIYEKRRARSIEVT